MIDIQKIVDYSELNPELKRSHHFLFDLPLGTQDEHVTHIVIGINPGERQVDWTICDSLAEETRRSDFHEEYGEGRKSVAWTTTLVKRFCGTADVVQTEFFFWSTPDTGESFKKRFGRSIWECTNHLNFCREMNQSLIEARRPSVIVAPGLTALPHVKEIYNLEHDCTVKATNGHRLVEVMRDNNNLPWLFTKHWSGSRGFTNEQRDTVREVIAGYET